MKNILVIGGSYFAGRVFVEHMMKSDDYAVHVFNRGHLPLRLPSVTEYVGDREHPDTISTGIPAKEWYAVIDFCGYMPGDIEILIHHLPGKIHHYLFISTTSVYAPGHDLPVKEQSPVVLNPQPELGPMSDYGFDKWRAECKLREICNAKGIHYTIFRPAIIYGRYNYAPRETYFFDLVYNRQPLIIPSDPLPLFSFVWVEDMACFIRYAIGEPKFFDRILNLSAPDAVSYPQLVEVIETISGQKLKYSQLSSTEIIKQGIPLPFPLDNHLLYDGTQIQKLSDIPYTPFLQGMQKTYSHYLKIQEDKKRRQGLMVSV
ncbi:MAG: NAD-dependent epimerase/dehydratase family protein [Deltaproteobacteria bacterium]|nr:NAD-dependent epimerase/dehydratase family protein [Deltaproteobacteria bacterium]